MNRPIVTMGVFDGCHLGHRAVVAETVRWAGDREARAVALTFDPHPRAATGRAAPALSTLDERIRLLKGLGLDEVQVLPFDQALRAETAVSFARRVFYGRFRAAGVVLGLGARFGHGRDGDAAGLAGWAAEWGMEVRGVPPVAVDGAPASSSRARDAVGGGRMAAAARLLGRPYGVAGQIGHGQGLARKLGLPTLNLALGPERVSPPAGVYAGWAGLRPEGEGPLPRWSTAAGESRLPLLGYLPGVQTGASPVPVRAGAGDGLFEAVLRVGPPPGVGRPWRLLEAHAFGLDRECYGQEAVFHFGDLLRPPLDLKNDAQARRQIAQDAETARQWHGGRLHWP